MSTIEREWRDFPLYVYVTEDNERFVLPTERDLKMSTESVNQLMSDIDQAQKQGKDDQVKLLQGALERGRFARERLIAAIEDCKSKAVLRPFKISWPTFGEFLKAEEDSKDWISGEPRIDESKLALNVLAGRVMLDGMPLGREQVQALRYDEAKRLWEEMKAMVYPNTDRLPFLGARDK
jgi:hypothetical protein